MRPTTQMTNSSGSRIQSVDALRGAIMVLMALDHVAPRRLYGDRTGPNGDQMKKSHPYAVRRLYLAIVNRAILDLLENGHESREVKRWLLSRGFDSLQAAVD